MDTFIYIFLSHLIGALTLPLNIWILKYRMHGKSSAKALNFSRYLTIGLSLLYSIMVFFLFDSHSTFCTVIYILRHAVFIALFVITLALIIDLLHDPMETNKITKTEKKKEEYILFAVFLFELFFAVIFMVNKGEVTHNKINKQCYIANSTEMEFIFTFGFTVYYIVFIFAQSKMFVSIKALLQNANDEEIAYRECRNKLIRQSVISLGFVPYLILRILQLVKEFKQTDDKIEYEKSYNQAVEIYTYCMPTLIAVMLVDPIKVLYKQKKSYKPNDIKYETKDINVSLTVFENRSADDDLFEIH